MTLTQLRYFLALCECGTFARAAEQCCVSQPTLSLQLKKLEAFVGVVLIDRSHTPVRPTPFGERFAQQVRAIFGEVSKLESLFETESPHLDGQLLLGCIPTVAYYLMLPILEAFGKNYPMLKISFYELPTHQLLDRVESGAMDVAILAGPIQSRHLHEHPLYYEPFYLLTYERSPVTGREIILDELGRYDLLMLSEEHCLRGQTMSICKFFNRRHEKSVIECSSVATMKSLVQAKIANAIVPELCLNEHDLSMKITDPQPSRVVSMVYRKNFHKTRTLDAIEQTVSQLVPKSLLTRNGSKVVGVDHD